MKQYAEIIVSIANKEVDRIFNYKIKEADLEKAIIGMRVIVPFGNGNKEIEGYIIGFCDNIQIAEEKIKYVSRMPDELPLFSKEMIELAKWMKDKYYTTLADCLKCIMPAGIQMKTDYIISVVGDFKGSEKSTLIINYILEHKNQVTVSELEEEFSSVTTTLKSLEKKGVIDIKPVSEIKDYERRVKFAYLNYDYENIDEIIEELLKKNNVQGKVLEMLSQNNGLAVSDIKSYLKISDSPIKTLEKNNMLEIKKIEVRRNIVSEDDKNTRTINMCLTKEQQKAVDFLKEELISYNKKPVLLHGVTGSGKTEIYMQLIEETIKNNKQAIVLVPEISLTPQTVATFVGRFGEKVTVTHSKLSLGERFDQWKKARDGQISIMIGPRSAVFTPFKNLGVIIIDEEHENTYTSETTPKFSTKNVAIKLSEITNALLVLGSATPSIESYYEAEIGKFKLISLFERVNKTLPKINLVDMREELALGNRSIFSKDLENAMRENIISGEQTILFLNRRGHSTFVSCRKCGEVMKCDNCNVNYTYHMHNNRLTCHYCGKEEKNPENCPVCGSKFIKYFGVGTQKIEDEVKKLFPNEIVLRMDMDTVSKKNSHEKILNEFKSGRSKILIGTQMIAKGLDFPNVSLVGIIAADLSLNNGDFRSAETTYQLLTQVSGRAGRAKVKGRVFVQTYNPQHYSIVCAKENDYQKFYNQEILLRRQMVYPPFSKIFVIMFVSDSEKEIIQALYKLVDIMTYYNNEKRQFEMLGPAPATVSKIRNKYRWRIIVKGLDEEKLKGFVFYCIDKLNKDFNTSNILMNLTLNPVLIY